MAVEVEIAHLVLSPLCTPPPATLECSALCHAACKLHQPTLISSVFAR